MNKNVKETERWLKRSLKKKVSITKSVIITFLVTGLLSSVPVYAEFAGIDPDTGVSGKAKGYKDNEVDLDKTKGSVLFAPYTKENKELERAVTIGAKIPSGDKKGEGAKGANKAVTIGHGAVGRNDAVVIGFEAESLENMFSRDSDGNLQKDDGKTRKYVYFDYATNTTPSLQSTAIGYAAKAGFQATAIGADTYALGQSSVAIGSDDIVAYYKNEISDYDVNKYFSKLYALKRPSGDTSKSLIDAGGKYTLKIEGGVNNRKYSPTVAAGDGAISIGSRSLAYKDGATAVGTLAFALGDRATAVGTFTRAEGDGSIALGSESYVFAPNSVATGNETQALSQGALAYGFRSYSAGKGSIAIGRDVFSNTKIQRDNTAIVNYINKVTENSNKDKSISEIAGILETEINTKVTGSTKYNKLLNPEIEADTNKNHGVEGIVKQKILNGSIKNNGIVIGSSSNAEGDNSIALGRGAFALEDNSFAIGSYSVANEAQALALGLGARSLGQNAIAIGTRAVVGTVGADNYSSSGENSIAIGTKSRTFGNNSNLVGANTVINGNDSSSFGYNNNLSGTSGANSQARNTALGNNIQIVHSKDSIAIGNGASVRKTGDANISSALAIGNGATVNLDNSVALGVASRIDYTVEELKQPGYTPVGGYSLASSENIGVISVGRRGAERRIVNVAPGYRDTDAVNVSQLKLLEAKVGNVSSDQGDNHPIRYVSVNETGKNEILKTALERIENVKEYINLKAFEKTLKLRSSDGDTGVADELAKVAAKIAEVRKTITETKTDESEKENLRLILDGIESDKGLEVSPVNGRVPNFSKLAEEIEKRRKNDLKSAKIMVTDKERKAILDATTNIENNRAVGKDSIAIGYKAQAISDGSIVIGTESKAETGNPDKKNVVVIGNGINANIENSVYLGEESVGTKEKTAATAGITVYNSETVQIDGQNKTLTFAGGTAAGVVTVGQAGQERRIQNVAAGLVDKDSTDAINGSQLYAVTQLIKQSQGGAAPETVELKPETAGNVTIAPSAPGKESDVADQEAQGNKFVTSKTVANAINNSGFNVKVNGGDAKLVKAGEEVKFVADDNSAISITHDIENNKNDVKFSLDKEKLTKSIDTIGLDGTPNHSGQVKVGESTDDSKTTAEDRFVKAGDIANAINKAGFKLKTNAANDTDGQIVNAGDQITINGGDGISLTRTISQAEDSDGVHQETIEIGIVKGNITGDGGITVDNGVGAALKDVTIKLEDGSIKKDKLEQTLKDAIDKDNDTKTKLVKATGDNNLLTVTGPESLTENNENVYTLSVDLDNLKDKAGINTINSKLDTGITFTGDQKDNQTTTTGSIKLGDSLSIKGEPGKVKVIANNNGLSVTLDPTFAADALKDTKTKVELAENESILTLTKAPENFEEGGTNTYKLGLNKELLKKELGNVNAKVSLEKGTNVASITEGTEDKAGTYTINVDGAKVVESKATDKAIAVTPGAKDETTNITEYTVDLNDATKTKINNAVTDATQAKNDVADLKTKGITFTGTNGKTTKTLDSTLAIIGNDSNITTDITDAAGVKIALNKDLKLAEGSVSFGDNTAKLNKDGLTVIAPTKQDKSDELSITTAGIKAGGKKITGVAKGDVSETSTDAINGSQLNAAKTELNNAIGTAVSNATLTYKADSGIEKKVALTDGLNFNSGNNITASVGENGIVRHDLKSNLSGISSISSGNDIDEKTKITLDDGGVTINDKTISGIKKGVISADSKEAINGSQLNQLVTDSLGIDVGGDASGNIFGVPQFNAFKTKDSQDTTPTAKTLKKAISDTIDQVNKGFVFSADLNNAKPESERTAYLGSTIAVSRSKEKLTENNVNYVGDNVITEFKKNELGAAEFHIGLKESPTFKDITADKVVLKGKDGQPGADGKTIEVDNGDVVIKTPGKPGQDGQPGAETTEKIITDSNIGNQNLKYTANGATDKKSTTLDDGLNFSNTENITASVEGNGVVKNTLNPELKGITSITSANGTEDKAKLTLGDNLTLNNKKITGVAEGKDDTDAVNVGQLEKVTKASKTEVVSTNENTLKVEEDTTAADGHSKYKLTVNTAGIVEDTGDNEGKVKVEGSDNDNKLVTAKGVADAINKAGFKVITSKEGDTASAIKTGDTLKLTAETNLEVEHADKEVKFKLADTIKLTDSGSVSFGENGPKLSNAGLTIGTGNNEVSVKADGINAGKKAIKNVLAGTDDTDAVNVGQLHNVANALGLEPNSDNKGFKDPEFTGLTSVNGQEAAKPTTIKKAIDQNIAKINEGLTFGDGKTSNKQQLGSSLNVKAKDGDKNLSTAYTNKNGNGTITISLSETPEFKGLTVKDAADKPTTAITPNGISITPSKGDATKSVTLTENGLDNGGNKITNVAGGSLTKDSTDVINGGQLHDIIGDKAIDEKGNITNIGGTGESNINDAIGSLVEKTDQLKSDALGGISTAVAMANLPQITGKGHNVAAAYGTYKGNHSVAVGLSGTDKSGALVYKASGALTFKGDLSLGIGFGYQFGQKQEEDRIVLLEDRVKALEIQNISTNEDLSKYKNETNTKIKDLEANLKLLEEKINKLLTK